MYILCSRSVYFVLFGRWNGGMVVGYWATLEKNREVHETTKYQEGCDQKKETNCTVTPLRQPWSAQLGERGGDFCIEISPSLPSLSLPKKAVPKISPNRRSARIHVSFHASNLPSLFSSASSQHSHSYLYTDALYTSYPHLHVLLRTKALGNMTR